MYSVIPEVPTEARPGSVFSYKRRVHSQKLDEFYGVIERMYPELPKMELFRRGVSSDGWYSAVGCALTRSEHAG